MTVLKALNKSCDHGTGNVIIDSTILNLSFRQQIEGHEKKNALKRWWIQQQKILLSTHYFYSGHPVYKPIFTERFELWTTMFQGHSFLNTNRILAGIKLIGGEWRGVLLCSCNLFLLLASTVQLLKIFETKELHKILLYKKLMQITFLATSGWTLQRTKLRHLFLSILQLT